MQKDHIIDLILTECAGPPARRESRDLFEALDSPIDQPKASEDNVHAGSPDYLSELREMMHAESRVGSMRQPSRVQRLPNATTPITVGALSGNLLPHHRLGPGSLHPAVENQVTPKTGIAKTDAAAASFTTEAATRPISSAATPQREVAPAGPSSRSLLAAHCSDSGPDQDQRKKWKQRIQDVRQIMLECSLSVRKRAREHTRAGNEGLGTRYWRNAVVVDDAMDVIDEWCEEQVNRSKEHMSDNAESAALRQSATAKPPMPR